MAQENVEIVRLAYAAMSERNLDALAEVTNSDWVFDFSRAIGPQKGVYRGREEIAQFAAATEEAFERFQLSPIEFLVGSAGPILVRHNLSAKGRGSGLEVDRVPDATLLWELREGKVIRTTLYNTERKPSKPWGRGTRARPNIEPVEITSPNALGRTLPSLCSDGLWRDKAGATAFAWKGAASAGGGAGPTAEAGADRDVGGGSEPARALRAGAAPG